MPLNVHIYYTSKGKIMVRDYMFPPHNICEMVTLAKMLGKELLIPEECPIATAHRAWQQVLSQSPGQGCKGLLLFKAASLCTARVSVNNRPGLEWSASILARSEFFHLFFFFFFIFSSCFSSSLFASSFSSLNFLEFKR